MGVNQQIVRLGKMTGDMQITNTLRWHCTNISQCITAMINTVDVDIVYVQQQVTIGLFQHLINKFRLRHYLARFQITGDIFDNQSLTENILHPHNPLRDIIGRRRRKRDGHQVVQMAVIAAIAQVLTVGLDIVLTQKLTHLPHQRFVQRCRAAD